MASSVNEVAHEIAQRVEKIASLYPGGLSKLDFVRDDPGLQDTLHKLFDDIAARRATEKKVESRQAVWKTIQVGTYKTTNELHQALVVAGIVFEDWADELLTGVTLAPDPTEIDLVALNVSQLGFGSGATVYEIYRRAESLGLKICPAEVGPQLLLQGADQERHLIIAMKGINSRSIYGRSLVFSLRHRDNKLSTIQAHPDDNVLWFGSRVVFYLPRNQADRLVK